MGGEFTAWMDSQRKRASAPSAFCKDFDAANQKREAVFLRTKLRQIFFGAAIVFASAANRVTRLGDVMITIFCDF
jgi:hypothetical protein